ncbi:unnamed protein product [Orchesella dallaii]|uniref:Uncharacterized protein n=1 Tax=Orchesella dallaii TaxID=48710 RepID=A0ABP1S1D9_9HEXA
MDFEEEHLKDVWMVIFEFLGDDDKINFANASPIWHAWVEKRVHTLLLAKVAPLLRDRVPFETLMGLRQVGSKFAISIDSALARHPANLWLEFESAAKENWRQLKVQTMLRSRDDIYRFLREMETSTRNPFPSSRLCIEYEEGWEFINNALNLYLIQDGFWKACQRLLVPFGHHLCHLELKYVFGRSFYHCYAASLLRALQQVPNLESLVLQGNVYETLRDVTGYYCNNSLPRLQNLESVKIQGMGKIVTESILRYCCVPEKVTRLAISRYDCSSLLEEVYEFCNLQVLEAAVSMTSLERLSSLDNLPPLREYHGGIGLGWGWIPPYDPEMFRRLQPFSSTLYKIRISGRFVAGSLSRGEYGSGLLFPNLKTLSFEAYQGFLDILVQFSQLERLEFDEVNGMGAEGDSVYLDTHRVSKSNIWTLFPHLKSIVLASGTYYRKEKDDMLCDIVTE